MGVNDRLHDDYAAGIFDECLHMCHYITTLLVTQEISIGGSLRSRRSVLTAWRSPVQLHT
jgi:hypothetical protein